MEPFMEDLLVCTALRTAGFTAEEEYQAKVDELFLQYPDSPLLLELEWEGPGPGGSWKTLLRLSEEEVDSIALDWERFGKLLMDALLPLYQGCTDLERFGSRAYALWELLPECLAYDEPFWTLNYANEPLSDQGDEAATRALYEAALTYYQTE